MRLLDFFGCFDFVSMILIRSNWFRFVFASLFVCIDFGFHLLSFLFAHSLDQLSIEMRDLQRSGRDQNWSQSIKKSLLSRMFYIILCGCVCVCVHPSIHIYTQQLHSSLIPAISLFLFTLSSHSSLGLCVFIILLPFFHFVFSFLDLQPIHGCQHTFTPTHTHTHSHTATRLVVVTHFAMIFFFFFLKSSLHTRTHFLWFSHLFLPMNDNCTFDYCIFKSLHLLFKYVGVCVSSVQSTPMY